jgi:hypothetical protein
MVRDGTLADPELPGDLGVRATSPDQVEDLGLTVGETKGLQIGRLRSGRGGLDQDRGSRAVRVRVTDQFGRDVPSATVTLLLGKRKLVSTLTDPGGAASLPVPRTHKGRLVLSATAPAARRQRQAHDLLICAAAATVR